MSSQYGFNYEGKMTSLSNLDVPELYFRVNPTTKWHAFSMEKGGVGFVDFKKMRVVKRGWILTTVEVTFPDGKVVLFKTANPKGDLIRQTCGD